MEAHLGRSVEMSHRHSLPFGFLYCVPRPINDPGIRSNLIVEVHVAIQFAT